MIPQELKDLKQWVCVNQSSKIPMQATSSKPASASDPTTWVDYETALASVKEGKYDGLGFVFNDNGLIGIDIDVGLIDGFLTPLACDIISKCNSYTEKSRSGRGMHIFVKGDIPFNGANNRAGVEIYKTSRYFITTGQQMLFKDIVENQDAINYVLETYFSTSRNDNQNNFKKSVIYSFTYDLKTFKPIFPLIPDGCRNLSLTSLAGQLKSLGYEYEDTLRCITHCNKVACTPPLKLAEVYSIAKSVYKYE